ncbi:hypothetical protein ECRG_03605 [Escherichia coli H617]|uniref:Uncharacterized protein n=1 Tax=Escherichia coli H386 TaxID=656397 RepID=A0A1X3JM43_ECOLX|nr:hypothetical protein ECVR50_0441 [Escherichia coli VR50]EGI09958.1 conserved hypothetical protein [Escherichia coli H736]EGI52183.1 conserved hypothetical protein [Escherichia coli H299]OSK32504.1 hypothetical protein EALG_02599 [Escherichia coli TA144]OSK61830.1 hypothetical protein EACG_00250 [Escherichia coli E560]OSL01144.1 hypothetical protein ECWG_03911 [Escherichia coli E1002]OSL16252.1 hypothetical protein ECVG_02565 [Escherichia coli H386]OSL21737.1 hypothetical protein ECSG_0434
MHSKAMLVVYFRAWMQPQVWAAVFFPIQVA